MTLYNLKSELPYRVFSKLSIEKPSVSFLPLIRVQISVAAGKAKKPERLSAQPHPAALPRGSQGTQRPDGIFKPSSMFWVCFPNWENTF